MRFVLELVTDAFLGGADKAASEADGLRPPSIRALIRFAWRALRVGEPLEQLATAEGELLGDCDKGQGVLLRPNQQKVRIVPAGQTYENSLPYLGYGPVCYSRQSRRTETQRDALAAGSWSDLSLVARSPLSEPQKKQLVDAVWLAGALFGLGSRSRRGFGSVQVSAWDGPPPPAPWPATCTTPTELRAAWKTFLRGRRPRAEGTTADWTGITQDTRIFVWNETYPGWQEALDAIGFGLHDYRQRLGAEGQNSPHFGPDHDLAYDVANGKKVDHAPERAAFGLPHNYTLRVRGRRTRLSIGPANDRDRRASPLLLHVTQLKTGEYLPVVGYLPARLLPAGVKLEMKAAGHTRTVPPPSDATIQRFLDGGEIEGRHVRGSNRPATDSTWPGLTGRATEVKP